MFTEIHDRAWYEAAGILMLIENKYDPWEGVLNTDFRFIENGVQTRQQTRQHCYTAAEIRRMLEGAGFKVLHLSSDLEGTKFSPGKQRLYVISERN